MPFKSRISVRTVEKRTTRSRAPAKKKKIVTFVPKLHSEESEAAVNYMFKYKIGEGRRPLSVHGGFYNYGPTKCQNMFNRKGRCPQGRKCRFAHTSLEVLFHPLVYKTWRCDKTDCKQGDACAWSHSDEDHRRVRSEWIMANPISDSERRAINSRASKKPQRVRLAQTTRPLGQQSSESPSQSPMTPSTALPSSSPEMSVSSSGQGSPPLYKSGMPEAMSVSTSVSPALKEEETVEMKEKMVEEVVAVAVAVEGNLGSDESGSGSGNEFERWYRGAFNCEVLGWMHYLKQFEAKELDDVNLLWDLYMESQRKKSSEFSDLLAREITMVDETARALFVQRLCEYKSPVDVRGWLARVVGLPEYADLFVSSLGAGGRVDDLVHLGVDGDDLAEMGVSLVGHRMKILYHLKKFGEFDL